MIRKRKPKQIKYIMKDAPYDLKSPCWICTSHKPTGGGYPHIIKNYKAKSIARHMYEKYNGKIPEGLIIRHKCDNKLCINPDHLELGTHKDNAQDRKKRGRSADLRGSNNSQAKLTEEAVITIRKKLKQGVSPKQLMREFNISKSVITQVKNGTLWSHVAEELIDDTDARKILTAEQASEIKKALNKGASGTELARKYGVNKGAIQCIKAETNWREVEPRITVPIKQKLLTEEIVRSIKRKLKEGKHVHKEIGEMYGVARTTISGINNGRTWAYVKVE